MEGSSVKIQRERVSLMVQQLRDKGQSLFGEDPTCPGATTAELKLLNPELPRACAPKREATAMRSPLASQGNPGHSKEEIPSCPQKPQRETHDLK